MFTLIRYAWAAPASFVGLLFVALAWALGARVQVCNGVLEAAGGALGRAITGLPRALKFDAITFGHVVLAIDADCLDACRAHEQVHVRQYERWGLLFFPLYLGSSLVQWLRGRHPYRDNHFEREAWRHTACGAPVEPSS